MVIVDVVSDVLFVVVVELDVRRLGHLIAIGVVSFFLHLHISCKITI